VSVVVEPHTVNGKRFGAFYHIGDECIYLAWRSGVATKSYHFKSNSWCLDIDTLRAAERRGCKYVGVAHKVGANKFDYYVTLLEDYFQPPSEPHPEGVTRQRRLNRYCFRLRMSKYGKRGTLTPTPAAVMKL
jgi:hypothetical protein